MFSLLKSLFSLSLLKKGSKASAQVQRPLQMSSVTTTCDSDVLREKARAALYGLFVGDASAMPTHWYYSLADLKEDYGEITGYVKPKQRLRGSIMNKSNTGGGGRGSFTGDIIGSVINHGKKKFWAKGQEIHYHQSLNAGEHTLEASLTLLLMKRISAIGSFNTDDFRAAYITNMRTPGFHNDTYASTCHRMFFANLLSGKSPSECPDNDGHNVNTIDALTLTVPTIMKYASANKEIRDKMVIDTIQVTRRTGRNLNNYAIVFSDLLVDVLNGKDLRSATEDAGKKVGISSVSALTRNSRDPMVS